MCLAHLQVYLGSLSGMLTGIWDGWQRFREAVASSSREVTSGVLNGVLGLIYALLQQEVRHSHPEENCTATRLNGVASLTQECRRRRSRATRCHVVRGDEPNAHDIFAEPSAETLPVLGSLSERFVSTSTAIHVQILDRGV